jgi:hypothetical protein
MSIDTVMAGIAVADFDAAVTWYERLLGRRADDLPMDGLAEWHFPETGVIQVIHDPDRAGSALLTLSVDDLEGHVAGLEEHCSQSPCHVELHRRAWVLRAGACRARPCSLSTWPQVAGRMGSTTRCEKGITTTPKPRSTRWA